MLFLAFILLSLFTVFMLTQVVNDAFFTSSIVFITFVCFSLILQITIFSCSGWYGVECTFGLIVSKIIELLFSRKIGRARSILQDPICSYRDFTILYAAYRVV